jgi:hypothetical protein
MAVDQFATNAQFAPSKPPQCSGLREFHADPIACMQRLYRTHGTLAAIVGKRSHSAAGRHQGGVELSQFG